MKQIMSLLSILFAHRVLLDKIDKHLEQHIEIY